MRRDVGASAGILALLAMVFHTQFPSTRDTGPESSKAERSGKSQKKETGQPAARREGPWIATRAFFQLGEAPRAVPESEESGSPCGGADKTFGLTCLIDPALWDAGRTEELQRFLGFAPAGYTTWSIVATMADPSHTRLPLFLDRQVEAVQRSLQAQGFELAGQWLPWSDRFDSSEPDIAERWKQRQLQREQEQMPGILVFRRFPTHSRRAASREALFVFLVPETPTSGVSGPAFLAAMRLAVTLSGRAHIGYLAPSFSGSFESLAALVQRWNGAVGAEEKIQGKFYGGTVSSRANAEEFCRLTGLKFHSGIASSEDYEAVFFRVLEDYGIDKRDVAYLGEDETAFSKPLLSSGVTHYIFPRDISHLRNVYQEETAAGAADKRPAAGPGVNFSIKDPNSGEDSVPTFSNAQTPLSQSSVVHSIMDDLRRRRTRLVYIRSTNVLDTLFLAQIVRQESPDTRVLTEDPDVLFVAAASRTPLDGTLSLSTYPMFFEADGWLSKSEQLERVPFSSPDFQGLYNVTQSVVTEIGGLSPDHASDRRRGFGQISSDRPHPGLWLLTLNHSGFLPIDTFDEQSAKTPPTAEEPHQEWFGVTGTAAVIKPEFPSPPRGWFITITITTAFVQWGCFLVVRTNRNGKMKWPVWLTLAHGRKPETSRLLTVVSALLAMSVIEWTLFVPAWFSDFEGSRPGMGIADFAGFEGWLGPVVVAAWIWRKRISRLRTGAVCYLLAILGLFALVSVAWLWCCAWQPAPARLLFRLRALELFSGSSPALPLFLLGAVMFMCSVFNLNRLSRAGLASPCLELAAFKSLQAPLQRSYQGIDRQIRLESGTGQNGQAERAAYVLAPLGIALVLLQATPYMSAFEKPCYNLAISAAVSVLLAGLTVGCYDLVRIWKYLSRMLSLIDLMPLRSSFRRVARDWPRRPIWASSQRLSKPFIARQMLSALHNRRIILGSDEATADVRKFWEKIPTRFDARSSVVPEEGGWKPAPHAGGEATVKEFLKAHRAYERHCANLLGQIVTVDLAPIWTHDLNEDEQQCPDGDAVQSEAKRKEAALKRYCGDFVALQFARYFIYVVGQIQAIAWCLSFSLLMLMLVLNSYSPQAPLLLARFLAAIFVAIGVVVFWVFAGMERNAILSCIAKTQPGQLNYEFWVQLIGMGILPLIGVLSHLFPSLSNFLYTWMAPGMESLH